MDKPTPLTVFIDVMLDQFRKAGFEDGIDFTYECPEVRSPRLDAWVKRNKHLLDTECQREMRKRGFVPVRDA